jgi:hypothetical protein
LLLPLLILLILLLSQMVVVRGWLLVRGDVEARAVAMVCWTEQVLLPLLLLLLLLATCSRTRCACSRTKHLQLAHSSSSSCSVVITAGHDVGPSLRLGMQQQRSARALHREASEQALQQLSQQRGPLQQLQAGGLVASHQQRCAQPASVQRPWAVACAHSLEEACDEVLEYGA